MIHRKLGNSGLQVPPLALGTNVFSWTVDEATAFTLLDAAVDAGLTFFDTADIYSNWAPGNQGGESETIIGNWLTRGGKRKGVILATKVGMEMAQGERGRYILSAAEASLRRLQTCGDQGWHRMSRFIVERALQAGESVLRPSGSGRKLNFALKHEPSDSN